ncbi:MAG: iron-sulfur cluster assembly scaffold protein [Parcubacteria group bacterium]
MYSKEVMEHFQNPRNMGALKDAHAVGNVGNPVCGDMMKIYLKISGGIIRDIGFETLGCVAAIATSSMITELAKGKTLEEAEKIEFKDVERALGSLPPIKMHCADLSVQALRKAIKEYQEAGHN